MLTEGVSEDRVGVARATPCFMAAVVESDSLADLKLRGLFKKINQGADRSCLLSFRSGNESPRLVMEHVLPSEAAKAAMGCRPSGGGVFAN